MTALTRTTAFEVLRRVATSDAYANLVLPRLLQRRQVAGRDAAFATELTYGTLRLRGRYDAIIRHAADRDLDRIDPAVLDALRLGAHQVLGMRVPAHAAVSETVNLVRERVGVGAAKFANAVLRRVAEREPADWLATIAHGDEPLAVVHSHPEWVVRAFRAALVADGRDGDPEDLLVADNTAAPVTLAARPGLIEPDELVRQTGGHPGRWASTAVLVTGDPAVPAVRCGLAGVQDEGSQLVTLALASVALSGPDQRWLDLAAGPGGKAALLGAIAAGRGAHLVANEPQPHRADLVRRAVAALDDVEVRREDGRELAAMEPGAYDRVLLDAPCTGLGALRRRPEARWRRQPGDLPALTALQRELLIAALDLVRPGGVVGYVTCSPHLSETRLLVASVVAGRSDVTQLDAHAALRVVAPRLPLGTGPGAQLWPHVHGTDAMHLALLRKVPGASATHCEPETTD